MSTGITCDESKQNLLDNQLAQVPWLGAEMMLSEANITPDHDTVLSDLSANEVSVTGYTRQSVSGWSASTLAAHKATAFAAGVTFLNTDVVDSGTIYCWGIVDNTGTHLIMAGRWGTPFVLVAGTGSFPTVPSATLIGDPP